MVKEFLIKKLLIKTWKQLGGCIACQYESEQDIEVVKEHHTCKQHDNRILIKIK